MPAKSLREQKKLRTRTTIARVAQELFIANGYDKTTLSDIAAAADISQRTIFSYFPSKEAIIFHDEQAFIESLVRYVKERQDCSIIDAIREFLNRGDFGLKHRVQGQRALRRQLLETTPALREYFSGLLARMEQQFAPLVAEERQLPADSIVAHMAASVITTGLQYSISTSQADNDKYAETVLRFIEGGLNNVADCELGEPQAGSQ